MVKISSVDNFQQGEYSWLSSMDTLQLMILNIVVRVLFNLVLNIDMIEKIENVANRILVGISNSTIHSICKAEPLLFMETNV